ncbi:MAG: precorrin-2 C(20)-methyltransferase [Gammaproteobacteria bacterium]|nr:precorrin-2 C(20)-methyltransferase [Gammaproteobacteria bacterium]
METDSQLGTLTGIGIGPGDPDLITLKGLKALQSAPVLAYPAPENGESLARRIVAPHLDGHHVEVCMRMPMVTARFPAQEVYDWAAVEIGEHLSAGRDVACLCEGDPFVYGSFSFLFERLVGRHSVRVIPGVSSVTACAAAVGAPLATRNDVLGVVPATLDEDILRARLDSLDAVAIIKVGRHLPKVRRVLEDLGVLDSARYVERATMPAQRTMALRDFPDAAAPYFSMILLHKRGLAWN